MRRTLPDPGFAGDNGSVDPGVAGALAGWARGTTPYVEALAVLQRSRVLVPVVAVLGEVELDEHGRAHDKTSDMATVLLTGPDGRRGLLAFTGSGPLTAWDPQARPVPVALADAARAALQDDADALLVDVAGPTRFVIEEQAMTALAAGHLLVRVDDGWAWAQPAP
ncbi:MAG: SseB family protein [Marmoricola sp.]